EVGLFTRTHGSGLFVRGDTQILAVTTLASPDAAQLVETMETTDKKKFMLHYNFPGFSTGETKRSRGPGRREIGHGALAAKAIRGVLPSKEEFPYTIRVVAETLSSNGSSSMASVCATTLSLMDAGVPIKKMVAGIAMGLMLAPQKDAEQTQTNAEKIPRESASSQRKSAPLKYKILTDIQGPEDHHGDMDMKVAGTEDGVTAVQMDVKVSGITEEIFEKTLAQAKRARLHILESMKKVLDKPRAHLSPFAPKIITIKIDPEKIGMVIGPGGKIINGLIKAANNEVGIDIEEDGSIFISSTNEELAQKTLKSIEGIVREFKVGDIVEGEVIKILDFGAIVDLGGDQDGMIHVSELREGFVKRVEDVVKLGSFVRAKVIRAEEGKIGLSIKALQGK
ncbi:MAG: polyribonucleotide nucleotidyltransferase, partial [Patescibacteria group bacterium]